MLQTTTIVGPDSRAALEMVARRLGPDAVVLSTRRRADGVEVVARVDAAAPKHLGLRRTAPAADGGAMRFLAQAAAIGIDRLTAERLLGGDVAGGHAGALWQDVMREVAGLPVLAPAHLRARHLCVVGDSGSGKTTTLAQLASRCRIESPDQPLVLLSGDKLRLGAREQLRAIGQVLGLTVVEPPTGMNLPDFVGKLPDGVRLLIDMPSDTLLARGSAAELKGWAAGALSILCTLPLTAQAERHRQMLARFSGLLDGAVVTHADEALAPGAVVAVLTEAELPLAYLGRSSDLLDGLETAKPTSLCRMLAAALARTNAVTMH